jgi:carbonic anhydrase
MSSRRPDAEEALARLVEGNARFAHNVRSVEALVAPLRRRSLVLAQHPFAIVLSCSDSRVPAEIVFDQGLGDLFVVRVAGNVIAPSLVGSVEFAAATFGAPLAVVMGHSRCGAVAASLDAIQGKGVASANIADIVERIRPAVQAVLRTGSSRDELLARAIRANVQMSVRRLRDASRILRERIAAGDLVVVGAEYSLESGEVAFLKEATTEAMRPRRARRYGVTHPAPKRVAARAPRERR